MTHEAKRSSRDREDPRSRWNTFINNNIYLRLNKLVLIIFKTILLIIYYMYRLVNGFKLVICIVDGIQCFGLTDPKHYFFAPVRCLFGYL